MNINSSNIDLVPHLPPTDDEIVDDLDDESEGSFIGSGDADSGAPKASPEETPVLAKRETQDVFRLRLAVLLVLVSSAIGAAIAVHFYLAISEETQFMHQFHEDSKKVFDEIGRGIDETMAAFDSMAVTLVSTANMTNQSWPFVTMADYAVRMSKVVPLTHAVVSNTYHVVRPDQRVQWENYTANNNGWVNEGMTVQKDWGGYYGPIEYNGEQPSTLYGTAGDVPMNIRYDRQCGISPQDDSPTIKDKLN
jgi:hypothetical protein